MTNFKSKLRFPIYMVKKHIFLRTIPIILQEIDINCQVFSFQGDYKPIIATKQLYYVYITITYISIETKIGQFYPLKYR